MNKIISLDSLQRLVIAPLKRLIDKKVDKVDGKGLSTNDYTDEDKEKLAGIIIPTDDEAMDMLVEMEVLGPVVDEENNIFTDENGNIFTI